MMTEKYGLLGKTLGHSFSPQIHALLGDYPYALYEVGENDVERFLSETDLAGMNVTIPYKQTVMPYCTVISEEASRIGSVNTLVRHRDGWHGYNTDYNGFRYMVEQVAGYSVRGKKGVIFGNGGAALAVRAALADMGAENLITVSRRGPVFYKDIDLYADAAFIVQATPVGTYPDSGSTVSSLEVFSRLEAVFDLVYNPRKTRMLLEAQEKGLLAQNGLPMLVAQAVKASELFTGKTIDDRLIEKTTSEIEKQLYQN